MLAKSGSRGITSQHSLAYSAASDRREAFAEAVAEEVPVALVYNGISHAVMMATPVNLEDFALGFSLTEELITSKNEIYDIEITYLEQGIAIELKIAAQREVALKERRRSFAGLTGCGLCGIASLTQAQGPVRTVVAPHLIDISIQQALSELEENQPMKVITGATHAAAWCDLQGHISLVREDIGRHNALDKLIGALVTNEINLQEGFALITSRASYEMVQKCCVVGIGGLVAVSASTSLAIERATQSGLKLIGFSRPGRHVVYTGD